VDVVQLENYSALLKTRLTGERRTSAILGVLLLLAALASTAASLLSEEPGRSLVIPWVVTFALGFGYLEARVRLQITRATAELVETLKRSASL
jgi:carbon starvation protein CstA